MPSIVQQGGTWGPILSSNSTDKIGQKCQERNKHHYLYKNTAKILPLGFIDDLSGISKCGIESIELNTFLTTQIELKKLKLHTLDKHGKSKCVKLHIGKKSEFCPTLKVHGTKMPEVSEESYLGDILSSDGKNTKNIKNRISKGMGIISQINLILEDISFGPYMFQIAILLRESMFINGMLTNAEIWYNFSENEIREFENLDKLYFKTIFKVPNSTPTEAFFLETGAIPISYIIKARRINYLHSILKRGNSGMLYSFFITQWHRPTRGDWTEQVKSDLREFNIPIDFDYIRSKSKDSFKVLVKKKSKELALQKLIRLKMKHSKLSRINYDNEEMEMQDYLLREDLSIKQKRLIFRLRTRMADFGQNYKGGLEAKMCPLCYLHYDSQDMSYFCPEIVNNINMRGSQDDIYNNNIKKETIQTMEEIEEYRKNMK